MDELIRRYDEADEATSLARESIDCAALWPSFKREAEVAIAALNTVIEKHNWILSKLEGKEKEDFEKSESNYIEAVKDSREKLMNHELMNLEEMFQKRYEDIMNDELVFDSKGMGGVAC
ncbi:hypothetical protein MKW94_019256 [Papaver nudicaule]|uniref:Uncharacterized protein n=1 Tax=Papaver nudicaule TaxID=74823 RepID=A0AA41V916_PAPNU|nr:hypothetical protein [Papaver nudicaule]